MGCWYSKTLAVGLAAITLSACAGSGDKYPSLAIRDVERAQGQFTPVRTDPPAPIRAVASASELDQLVEQALQANRKFDQAQFKTAVMAGLGRDAGIESNRRQQAMIAIADLISIRSETALALAELDLLGAQAATTFAPGADIAEARRKVELILEGQDGAIAGIVEAFEQ